MKQICTITTVITICGAAYGDIASTDYVNDGLGDKQGLLSAGANISIDDDTIAYIPSAFFPKPATRDVAGILKLYNDTGTNTDGALTQDAITTILGDKQDKIPTGPSIQYGGKYNVIWDGNTGEINFKYIPLTLTCPSGDYDIGLTQCVSANTNGSAYGYINPDGTKSTRSGSIVIPSTYGLTENGTWGVTFSYGKIKGTALCSTTNPSSNSYYATVSEPNSTEGQYCWSKMTEPAVSGWVFTGNFGQASSCAGSCANECARLVYQNTVFRTPMFGAIEK